MACAKAPKRIQPQVNIPEKFSQSGESVLQDKWWQAFKDTNLNDLMDIALNKNFSLKAAWSRLAQANAVATQSSSWLYPQLDANGNLNRSDGNGPRFNTTVSSVNLVASYELDLWGKVRSAAQAAQFDVLASQAQVKVAAITLSANLASTWFALVEQRGQLDVLNEQVKINTRVLNLIELRFRQGQSGAADVLRQKQLLEQTVGNITLVKAQIDVLSHQVAILTGREPNVKLPNQQMLNETPIIPKTGIPSIVLMQRPDVEAAFHNIQAADLRVAVAIAEQFPNINLSASLNTVADNPSALFSDWFGSIVAQFTAPIFNAGRLAAEVDRTRAVLSEQLANYQDVILTALQEIEDAMSQYNQQVKRIDSIDKQLAISNQVVKHLNARYIQGSTAYLDVMDALISQQSLAREQLTARVNLTNYYINLSVALAGGWTLNQPTLFDVSSEGEIQGGKYEKDSSE